MGFKDKNLEKLVRYKLGKFSPESVIEDGELDNITEMTINNKSFSRSGFKY